MGILLELLRILIICTFLGGVGWFVLNNLYTNEIANQYSLLGAIAIFLLLFVLYRNKLQFSGWYKGEGRKKLSKPVTWILVFFSIILIILPFIFGLFND